MMPRTSYAVASLIALMIGSCGSPEPDKAVGDIASSTPSTSEASSTSVEPATTIISTSTSDDTIRVDIADGCPATVAGHHDNSSSTAADWIENPDTSGLDTVFVPGEPTAALICRYKALTDSLGVSGPDSGSLFSSTPLGAEAATTLATTINDIVPSSIVSACLFANQEARYTAIAFAVPGRSDVDLWLKDWIGCPELSNGIRASGELINGVGSAFLSQLDAAAPPAPQPNLIDDALPTPPSSSDQAAGLGPSCSQWATPLPGWPTDLGDGLAAAVSLCPLANFAQSPVVDGSTLWLAGTADDGSPTVIHLDSSMTAVATDPVPSVPIAIEIDEGTLWAITSKFAGFPADLIRLDTATGRVLSRTTIAGTHLNDGPVPPASIAAAGDDVWVSIANGPMTVLHYRRDGTLAATVSVSSLPAELAAVSGQVFLITTLGDVVAIDATTNTTTRLASLSQSILGNDQIAAAGTDLWADAGELVHIDLVTGAIDARTPVVVHDLAADPHQPGRAWAAGYETDPNSVPSTGAGAVVRLAVRGVEPDGVLFFDTLSGNGINQLAVANDGTVFGEIGHTGQLARIVPEAR